ncbi:MAG: tandem-95 repeat protein [Gammaproteobacteria bacterium]
MTHSRIVSTCVLWLITIVLSLTGALAHATTCDVDADGDIDRKDVLAILADIGERASGPNDPRDADRNGRILSNDAQLCARRCTLALCAIPANKAPIAKNDSATTALDTPVRINVIANDRDRDGRIVPRTVRIVTKPKHGKVTNHRNGTVTYSPALGFRGRDSFRYTVKDNRGAKSNVAKVTVTVRPGNVPPVNVPPVANNDSAGTSVNTPVTINVVANDTDANGNLDPATVAIASNPTSGTVVNNADGTVTYTPNTGFSGTDSFTYNVKDTQNATSNTATVTVGVNATPVANAGPDANALTGQPATLDGSGSSDPNGDMITFFWRFLSLPPGSNLTDASIVNPNTPAPSFTPDVDGAYELELTVTDPGGLTGTDTVIITAATANTAPNADAGPDQNAEVLTLVNLDGSGSSDPDNGPVTPLTFQWSFVSVPLGSGIDETDLQPDANSTQPSFTPDVIGLYQLTLTVSDGDLSDSDDVDINVALPNVPPNADAGLDIVAQLGPPAETATLDGSGSNDPDNGPVTPLTFTWTFVSVALGSGLGNGDITGANTATPSFTPDQPGMYTLQLVVFDGSASDSDEVMVTANAAPVALADAFDVDEETPLTVPASGVLANDTDANNDPLTAVLDSGPGNASGFSLSPDGSFTYTPNDNFTGDDTFTYHANDGSADSNVATVTITVNPVNDPPVAVDDPSYTTNEDGGALAGTSVLTNDTDAENDTLTAVLNTGPTNAQSFNLNADGTFSYTPNANFFGIDTFTYHANDGNSDSNVATVTITVDPVNDAPAFNSGGNVSVLEDAGSVTVAWATGISAGPANESGQTLNFLESNDNNGLFSVQPTVASNGALSFTPLPNAFGSATVTVTLQDNGGTANSGVDTSGPQTFTITVMPVNDPPVATVKSHQTHSGIRVTIGAANSGKLKDGATDVDDPFGDLAVSASFTSITPAGATIVLSDAATGTFTYNPQAGFSGAASFQFQVCDDGIPTAPAMCSALTTVSFTITGPDLWFVDDSAGAGGTGRLTDPFDALSDLAGGRGTGDRIFVFTGTYGTGHTLLTNEQLIGQGSSGTFDSVLGVTAPGNGTLDARPALGGTRPQLNGTVALGGGSTVRGLNIASAGVTGLSGGAVAGVNVSEASVTSTTGTAVNLNGTGGTVSLTAVSSNAAANGIVLNTTTGTFTVTGSGTPGSGGTIQSTTGAGILLTNAAGISLARMIIQNGGDDGIRGTTVTGFTLANSALQNNGNAIGAFNAGDNGLDFTNLLGTASITSSTITGSFHNNIIIRNSTGTLSGLTVTGATISNNVSASDGDGFLFEASGTANMSVNVSGSTFSAHQGDHFQAAALNSGVLSVIFSGNTLSGGHATALGQGITINAATGLPSPYEGSVSYDIVGNTINGAISNAIFVGLGTSAASSSMIGKIRNNTIGTSGSALSCSTQANGVSVDARGNGTFTSAVTGNVIRQCFDRGILSEAGDGDSVLNLTVTGNTIDQQVGALAREAIQTNHGITSTNVFSTPGTPDVDTNVVCLQLGGAGALANTFSHGGGAPDDFRLRKRFEATVRLPGYAGGTDQTLASLAQVVAFIQAQNTGSAGEPGSASASGTGGGYTGGAACPLPP